MQTLDVPLSECFALTELPKHWPVAAGGRRLHKHTGFRYVSEGVAGVKLRAIRVPSCGLMTHAAWVAEFIAAINAQRLTSARAAESRGPRGSRTRAAKPRGDRKAKTAATLARMGLAT